MDLPQKLTGSGRSRRLKIGLNFKLKNPIATQRIDQFLPNRQLEQLERFKIYTWVDGIGGRRREIDGFEVWTTSAASSPNFGESVTAGGGRWLG